MTTPAEKAASEIMAKLGYEHPSWRDVIAPFIQAAIDESLPKWRPISSAPRQGRVLVWTGTNMFTAYWGKNPFTDDEAWVVAAWDAPEGHDDQVIVQATHWMPLPQPPEDATR